MELPQCDDHETMSIEQLLSNDLLSSIYAETLRLHIISFIPVVPMHGDLKLGK